MMQKLTLVSAICQKNLDLLFEIFRHSGWCFVIFGKVCNVLGMYSLYNMSVSKNSRLLKVSYGERSVILRNIGAQGRLDFAKF